DDDRGGDQLALEPVLRRALLQRIFQRAEKARHHQETEIVEMGQERPVGLVEVDQEPGGGGYDDAWAKVDQKEPMPGEPVGQIAADRGADGRRKRRDEPNDRSDERLFRAREDGEGRGEY